MCLRKIQLVLLCLYIFLLYVICVSPNITINENIKLGTGRDADVYQVSEPKLVAKKYKNHNVIKMLDEIYMYKYLGNHENIIKFYDYNVNDSYILFEKADSDLTKYYEKKYLQYTSMVQYEKHIKKVLMEIIKGIQYIHNKGYAHTDIKPSNILLIDDKIKISDLSDATKISEGVCYMCGTQYYSSPESEMYRYNLIKSDIFSFGILYSELLYSNEYILNNYDNIFENENGISNETLSFVKLLIHPNPMMRPTVEEIILWLS